MIRLIVILLLISYLAISCIDRVELPIRTEAPRLVVEGQITNEAPPYSVRLTYTGNFGGENGQNPADQYVSGAQVTLADDQGRSTRMLSRGQGIYLTSDTTFRGQIGRTYSLSIVLSDGKRYVSKPEKMPAVPVIDSISKAIVPKENFPAPYYYEYSVNTLDPANEKNYYRWTGYAIINRLSKGKPCNLGSPSICFDRCWVTVPSTDVNIYSDDAINGKPLRNRLVIQAPIYAIGPQLVEIVQYGITQSNYQFWKLYQQQNARTGSIFDPLPAPVTGNVVNAGNSADLARGYFAATSITRKRLRVQDYTSRYFGALNSYIFSQTALYYQGDCRDVYGQVPVVEPEGWQ
ncbi:hypothetical protein GCM10027592_14190 [Spirosoma flavus]